MWGCFPLGGLLPGVALFRWATQLQEPAFNHFRRACPAGQDNFENNQMCIPPRFYRICSFLTCSSHLTEYLRLRVLASGHSCRARHGSLRPAPSLSYTTLGEARLCRPFWLFSQKKSYFFLAVEFFLTEHFAEVIT